jgi:hypothetical protein
MSTPETDPRAPGAAPHRLPNDSELVIITGRRGSGKSMGALHQLSHRSFDEKPWFILDFKGDDVASRVPTSAPLMGPDEDLPTDPGLYAIRCDINDAGQNSAVDRLLCEIYDQGHAGVMIDEGMFLGQRNAGLRRIALAGRSRGVPLIFVTQRLMKCDTDCLAEADWINSYHQVHPDDVDRVAEFIPRNRLSFAELARRGEFYSYSYHAPKDSLRVVPPGDDFQPIYDRILSRLPVYMDEADELAAAHIPPPRRHRV